MDVVIDPPRTVVGAPALLRTSVSLRWPRRRTHALGCLRESRASFRVTFVLRGPLRLREAQSHALAGRAPLPRGCTSWVWATTTYPACSQGVRQPAVRPYVLELKQDALLVVRGVPVLECPSCSHRDFDDAVTRRLDMLTTDTPLGADLVAIRWPG